MCCHDPEETWYWGHVEENRGVHSKAVMRGVLDEGDRHPQTAFHYCLTVFFDESVREPSSWVCLKLLAQNHEIK